MQYPIPVSNSDTGALTLSEVPPVVMIGTLVGGIIGYQSSNKHKIIGTLVGLSLGGWIGRFANQP